MSKADFVLSIKDAAIASCKGKSLFPSIVIAQACLESNFGLSQLSVQCKNFFGIKAGSTWKAEKKTFKTTEYINGHPIKVDADFCAFKDFQQCLEYHNAMLHRVPTYGNHGLFKCTSPEGQANVLRLAGYATDPGYPKKLIDIVNEFHLRKYDSL